MRLILLGCPGAGKGTQAKMLADRYRIPQISTGEILRTAITAKSELGLKVKNIVEKGYLVPDSLIIKLVEFRLHSEDCRNGFLLDGFPRTLAQAEALQEIESIDYVIDIDVPEEEVIRRLSGRRIHSASGRTYHTIYQPPQVPDKDDVTGEALVQRPDDHEEVIRKRLAVYQMQTEPLRDFYMHLHIPHYIKINGIGSVEEVKQKILHALETQRFVL